MKTPLGMEKYESAARQFGEHIAALRDPKTGPAIIQAALDKTMGDIVENSKRFGLAGCFTEPYGEFLDPVETTLVRLRELAGTK